MFTPSTLQPNMCVCVCVYIQINKYIPNICNITHGPPEKYTLYTDIYKHNDDVEVHVMLTYIAHLSETVWAKCFGYLLLSTISAFERDERVIGVYI